MHTDVPDTYCTYVYTYIHSFIYFIHSFICIHTYIYTYIQCNDGICDVMVWMESVMLWIRWILWILYVHCFLFLEHFTLISPRSPWRQQRKKGRDHSAIGRGAKLVVATGDGRTWLLPVTGELNNVASPSVTRAGWRMLLGVRPSSSRELHGSAASWREEASVNSIEDITSSTQALEGCHLLDPQGLSACGWWRLTLFACVID